VSIFFRRTMSGGFGGARSPLLAPAVSPMGPLLLAAVAGATLALAIVALVGGSLSATNLTAAPAPIYTSRVAVAARQPVPPSAPRRHATGLRASAAASPVATPTSQLPAVPQQATAAWVLVAGGLGALAGVLAHRRLSRQSSPHGGWAALAGAAEILDVEATAPIVTASEITASSSSEDYPEPTDEVRAALSGISVFRAADGEEADAGSLVPAGRSVLLLLTDFADFDSWEAAARLVDELPRLQEANIPVACIGVGTSCAAREFCARTNLPADLLYADPDAACHRATALEPGFGREGGLLGELQIPGTLKLLVMCAGIGSRNTLKEVFRGYLGDEAAPPVFREGSNVDIGWRFLFDFVGRGYQRPFELATWRLINMIEILSNWDRLAPANDQLLCQRGGAFVLQDGRALLAHRDTGILGYADPARLVRAALRPNPAALPSPSASLELVRRAARRETVDPKDVFLAIRVLERQPKQIFDSQQVRGQWRLCYNSGSGVKETDAQNLARSGGGGYFPLNAVQSFDPAPPLAESPVEGRIRNGIFQGPLAFFFDGPMVWRDGKNILEFTFTNVAVGVGKDYTLSQAIPAKNWNVVGVATDADDEGIAGAKAGKNPFFKIIHVDDQCIVARGRGGGVAVWSRVSATPVQAAAGEYELPAL